MYAYAITQTRLWKIQSYTSEKSTRSKQGNERVEVYTKKMAESIHDNDKTRVPMHFGKFRPHIGAEKMQPGKITRRNEYGIDSIRFSQKKTKQEASENRFFQRCDCKAD